MNILLIDDEYYILKGLGTLLERRFSEHTTYLCDSAEKAVGLLEKMTPDIVISDINLSKMNGLDFIDLLHQKHPDTRVIIISGYSDFSYAQRAVDLRVTSYILKPINQELLVQQIQKNIQEVRQSRMALQESARNICDARRKVILDLIHYGFREIQIRDRLEQLGMSELLTRFYAGVLILKDFQLLAFSADTPSFTRLHTLIERILESCMEALPASACMYTESSPGEYLIVTNRDMTALSVLLPGICDRLREELGLQASFGVSDLASDYNRLFYAYQKAKDGAAPDRKAQPYEPDMDLPAMIAAFGRNFSRIFYNGDLAALSRELSFAYDYMASGYRADSASIQYLYELHERICRFLAERFPGESGENTALPQDCDSVVRLKPFIQELQARIDNLNKRQNELHVDALCEKVRRLVETECASVTLQSAAEAVNLSYTQLSIIFKEHTGENFKDYVCRVKMEKARVLLRTDKKIYQIAGELGYSDIKYFSRLFKRLVGETPNEYRLKSRPTKRTPGGAS